MIPAISGSPWWILFSTGGAPEGTETSSTARAKEDLELAQWLELLENYELVSDLEMLELMPALEEDDD